MFYTKVHNMWQLLDVFCHVPTGERVCGHFITEGFECVIAGNADNHGSCVTVSIFRRWVWLASKINPARAKRFKKTLASCLTFQEKQVAVDPISPSFQCFGVGDMCGPMCVSLLWSCQLRLYTSGSAPRHISVCYSFFNRSGVLFL